MDASMVRLRRQTSVARSGGSSDDDRMSDATYAERIRRKLDAAFRPNVLEIVDESSMHAGHSGARPGGETHFAVTIASGAFDGLNRVARHRAVYDVLSEELAERVHALRIDARTPTDG